jgi:branched-chain amino acid transport system permease protein
MSDLLQTIFIGLSNGSVYGVIGLGFVVVHRITGVVNFAQGDFAVAGAFATIVFYGFMPLWAAIIAGMAVAALIAAILYALAVRPLRRQGVLVQVLVTLGAAIMIRSIIQFSFGTRPYDLPPFTAAPSLRIAGASISVQSLWLVGIALLIALVLYWFFDRTYLGKALRACEVNPYAAGLVGINVALMATISFALSGGIAALIASAQVPLTFVTYSAGIMLALKGFAAAILGGLDRIWPTVLGGFLVGCIEAGAAIYISSAYQNVAVFAFLLLLLVLKPSGIGRVVVSERV